MIKIIRVPLALAPVAFDQVIDNACVAQSAAGWKLQTMFPHGGEAVLIFAQ